ncbi:MAG: aminopeptidase P family protein [Acidobacteria bacterium]|nr:aminopeptidase P family protein [Acidobacteriota bacterium]
MADFQYPLVPKSEVDRRLKNAVVKIAESGLNAWLISGVTNLYYFTGTAQSGLLFIFDNGKHLFLVRKSLERARDESGLSNISGFRSLRELAERVKTCYGSMPRKVGFEGGIVPVSLFARYRHALPDCTFSDVSTEIRWLRSVKSDFEQQCMREAGKQTEAVFRHMKKFIQPGLSELDIAAEAEYVARIHGHQGIIRMNGFNAELYYGVITAGESANLPTNFDGPSGSSGLYPSAPHPAGRVLVEVGKPVLIDFMGAYMGYLCDETRVYFPGDPSDEVIRLHQNCVQIQLFISDRLKPGTIPSRLYEETRQFAEEMGLTENLMGFGPNQVKFFGHGLGLEVDELPVIAPRFDLPLVEGVTIAVEPKYYLAGLGAVGVENTFVVKAKGGERLVGYPDDLIPVSSTETVGRGGHV